MERKESDVELHQEEEMGSLRVKRMKTTQMKQRETESRGREFDERKGLWTGQFEHSGTKR